MKKRKKKKQLFISCLLALLFLSFFVTCQLCSFTFSQPQRVSVSFPSHNKNAIHPIHRRRRGTHSLSLSLSLSLFLLFRRAFYFVSRSLFPSPASFFLSVALRDDDFCDYIFGYLFGLITRETFVSLLTLISFLSLSCMRIPVSNVCE
jgi:hypothetical protein